MRHGQEQSDRHYVYSYNLGQPNASCAFMSLNAVIALTGAGPSADQMKLESLAGPIRFRECFTPRGELSWLRCKTPPTLYAPGLRGQRVTTLRRFIVSSVANGLPGAV